MKILVLGDIHGRKCWKFIIEKEDPDKIIFLGDYVSTHSSSISSEDQIEALIAIMELKENNPEKVILLRGNHDLQHLGYYWADCCATDYKVLNIMSRPEFQKRFLEITQWVYINENLKTVFSHSGISQVWMDNSRIKDIHDINNLEPSELFGFTPASMFDTYGQSVTQPLVWIRPQSLCKCNIIGWDQVVGHTPVKQITDIYKSTKKNQHIWLCDTLEQEEYLIIDNGTFITKKLN